MNKQHALQNTFRALADPTRREILILLSKQDMTIGEVVDKFDITRAAVKKHLNMLEKGQLIHVRTEGRERINTLIPHALQAVNEWLNYFEQFWDTHLNTLQTVIEKDHRKKST